MLGGGSAVERVTGIEPARLALKATTRALYESQLKNRIGGTALGRVLMCDLPPRG